MELSVIIPAYNEEKRIQKTLKTIIAYLDRKKHTYEIIVVNDGSTDKTKEIIEEYIDATIYDRGGEEQKSKERKQSLGLVGVLNIDKKTRERLDFLDLVDFESLKREFLGKGELSEKNQEIFKKAFDNCQDFIEKIEETMGYKIKNSERTNFRKSFYQNPEKILKFSNKISKEEIEKIQSGK